MQARARRTGVWHRLEIGRGVTVDIRCSPVPGRPVTTTSGEFRRRPGLASGRGAGGLGEDQTMAGGARRMGERVLAYAGHVAEKARYGGIPRLLVDGMDLLGVMYPRSRRGLENP